MRGRRLGGILLGTLLATLVAWSPPAVQPALAAGPLRIAADTTYTVDAADGRVHVAIQYRMTNNKPDTSTTIYYYRGISLGVQPDARNVRASDRAGGLPVSTTRHRFFTEVEVRLRSNLYYGRTTSFTLRFDLVGAKPRSAAPTRVGRAFVTFGVWAFGDPDQGSVEVRMPPEFTTSIEGDAMTTTTRSSGNVARATPAEPDAFFAIVTGDNSAAYDSERLALGGGVNLVVLSWPEDDRWSESVTSTLRDGMPELQELIGLDWPVEKDLKVTERYTPALEGYAGLFFTDDERIDVSEDLDPATIVHEASHAWFNDRLFEQRWVYEGLAEEYAWRVLTATGRDPQSLPDRPGAGNPGAQPLISWTFPEAIRDQHTSDEELYGYRASFWVMHQIVEAAGEDRMRLAFEAADSNITAYPGAGVPESVAPKDGWHRFLDLVEPPDVAESPVIEDAIRTAVTTPAEAQSLDARAGARAAYRALIAAGDGWLPPWYVREPLGSWLFPTATARMDEASALLARRDGLEAAAAAEGLALDDELETSYEGASEGFGEATKLADAQLGAVDAIAAAHDSVEAEPDLFAQIGLLGETEPVASYEAARAAFQAGDLATALQQAGTAVAVVTRAPALGHERVIMATIVVVALGGFLVFVLVLRRRRDALDPSGTLGGHPAAPPPDVDGGPAST